MKGEKIMYIDVPTNTDLVLDDEKEITVVAAAALKTFTDAVLVFTAVAGVYTIASAGIGTMFDDVGDQIIVRGSIDAGVADNDGVYTVKSTSADAIVVNEPVVNATSDAAAQVDEFDTFILHPTKRTGQICAYIKAAGTPASFEVSFVPGGYWASKIEKGLPVMQGAGILNKQYLIQVETAPYLQTEEETLTGTVDKKGTLLMRVFPKASEALTVLISVGLVQLA